jgi:spore maturation protein CgeB
VIKIQTAYEPTIHFPPPAGWSDAERTRDVSFIGTAYDDRPEFLTRLWRECGPECGDLRQRGVARAAGCGGGCGDLYRERAVWSGVSRGVWRSKINLSFLTHSNQDEFAHKSFEIAACGGFLLAERSEGHAERFVEDEEAVFFAGFDECVAKIRRYLPDEAARARIAAAGRERAVRSGYSNDVQMAKMVERLRGILHPMKS